MSHADGVNSHYDQSFYGSQVAGSLRSARSFSDVVIRIIPPISVVDIGCGRGTWLKAFLERGAERAVGIDGPWNSQDKMIDQRIQFVGCDLENAPLFEERFDLSLSVEVGEHLSKNASDQFVASLCSASDFVIFGAAIPGQGGINHINEQPPSYWARKFFYHNYLAYDIFRPRFWGDESLELYYPQNTFLYVRNGAAQSKTAEMLQFCQVLAPKFMDVRHPDFDGIKMHLAGLGKATKKRLRQRAAIMLGACRFRSWDFPAGFRAFGRKNRV